MQSIFQSEIWESFKLDTGYQKSFWLDGILVLVKSLPLGRSILYSPMIPEESVNKLASKQVSKLFFEKLVQKGNKFKSIFYRAEFDSSNPLPAHLLTCLPATHFVKAFEEMQPEHTLCLDLTVSKDELLAQMKQKGRYNIKVAERSNMTIDFPADEDKALTDFYELYSATAKRHRITYRNKAYFESLIAHLKSSGQVALGIARIKENNQEIPVAAAIIVYSGKKAIYLFGASSDQYRNLMAPYLLHWQIIQSCKEKGCTTYDFFGIAPNDDPAHPWAGVTRFKKQFGGSERSILGSYDLPLRPLEYQFFKFAEKIRRKQ